MNTVENATLEIDEIDDEIDDEILVTLEIDDVRYLRLFAVRIPSTLC